MEYEVELTFRGVVKVDASRTRLEQREQAVSAMRDAIRRSAPGEGPKVAASSVRRVP